MSAGSAVEDEVEEATANEEGEAEDEEARIARVHAEADAFFAAVDENGDGSISSVELSDHLATVGYATQSVDRIFTLLDVNSDGSISREELRDAFVRYEDPALRLALGLGTGEADAIFEAIDANSDGELTLAELRAYLEQKGYPGATADTVFATLDVNADGGVSREELRDGYVRYAALRQCLGLSTKPSRHKTSPVRLGRGKSKA